jgi:hypothetical protein
MKVLKNFVSVDWRSGRDRIYFFFKENNTYSLFDIGDDATPDEYPTSVNYDNWHNFHKHVKHLRFGFTTTNIENEPSGGYDQDYLWLFYYEGSTPMVCKYDQDTDKVIRNYRVDSSVWHTLLPYFDRIVAGVWWRTYAPSITGKFRFLMNDGNSLFLDFNFPQRPAHFNEGIHELELKPITNTTWPGLQPYKHRIISAAQNDRTFADSYLYIFLTDNEYVTYNIAKDKLAHGLKKIDDHTWPGLLRD